MSFHLDISGVRMQISPVLLELGAVRTNLEQLIGWERPVKRIENALHHLRTAESSIGGYLEKRPTGIFARKEMDDFVLMIANAAVANGKIVAEMAREELEKLKAESPILDGGAA